MKKSITFCILFIFACTGKNSVSPRSREEQYLNARLTPGEYRVIVEKATEWAFSGIYNDFYEEGIYACKRCRQPLYSSDSKFNSGTGWPSFDKAIQGAVLEIPDSDGKRTELICSSCRGHLGHLFKGEGFTPQNIRHCINSVSLDFIPREGETGRAYFAGGCFWGVETLFLLKEGVIDTTVGYMGGDISYPTYKEVITGSTGHKEAVEVIYDPEVITYKELSQYFYEIHNPEQSDGQGPDIGDNYLSVVYYLNGDQKAVHEELIAFLTKKNYTIATTLEYAGAFWPGEEYHQNYYEKNGGEPYCHYFIPRF